MASTLKGAVVLLIAIVIAGRLGAQSPSRSFPDEIRFVQYLLDKEQYRDAIAALNELSPASLNPSGQDTLNYLKGWSFYNLKLLDSSAHYLLKVTPRSDRFFKSRFFSAYNYTYLRSYDNARSVLRAIRTDSSLLLETRHFEQAGIALLERNFTEFDSIYPAFSFNYYALAAQEKDLENFKEQLQKIRRRSPAVAGLLSAIVPGTGKIYAGKPYQGIAAMLPVAALALLTNESYHKRGPHSAEFYIFGTMLTVFYVGNIWGSVFAVKIKRDESARLMDQKLLLDLQIPLRTIFN